MIPPRALLLPALHKDLSCPFPWSYSCPCLCPCLAHQRALRRSRTVERQRELRCLSLPMRRWFLTKLAAEQKEARDSAGQRKCAIMAHFRCPALSPRCLRAAPRCLRRCHCAFSLPLRIFAAPCALPLLSPALPCAFSLPFDNFGFLN